MTQTATLGWTLDGPLAFCSLQSEVALSFLVAPLLSPGMGSNLWLSTFQNMAQNKYPAHWSAAYLTLSHGVR